MELLIELATQLNAAAAAEAPTNEFGYWTHESPWWELPFMMLVLGLFFLPASLIVAWLLSRFKLDKSVVLNATLCGAFAVVLFLAIRFYNFVNSLGMSTDVASESLFSEDPGFRLGMVAIFAVSWVGAMALTWWLKKRRSEKSSVDLEAFE